MNLQGDPDGSWEYRPATPVDYWVVAAPEGTTAADLKRQDLPALALSSLEPCVESGEPFLVLAEAATSSCLHPVLVPDIPRLFVVEKHSGAAATFTLRRVDGRAQLVSVE